MKRIIAILAGAMTALAGAIWLGLRVRPQALAAYPDSTPDLEKIKKPAGLPEPVARYYDAVFSDGAPLLTSAVISARGKLRFGPLTFPARLRFTHAAGRAYRHYIEATFFGLPIMKVNESYLDGHARLELPFGVVENEPKIDLAANLGLWAESIWLPSVFFSDPGVRWEDLDDTTARLFVPFGKEGEDSFKVTFDPDSGLIHTLETLRYREAADQEKIRWRNQFLEWTEYHGVLIPCKASVTWMDQGIPWLEVTLDDVVYNGNVSEYLKALGP